MKKDTGFVLLKTVNSNTNDIVFNCINKFINETKTCEEGKYL